MNYRIITIGRQYGSGGREIGEKLAQTLGVRCYDALLLERSAEQSGISQSVLERYDEQLTDKWLNLALFSGGREIQQLPLSIRASIAQFETIRNIARSEPAVIIGRCADYVLRERNDVFSVFVHASLDRRIARVAARNQIGEAEAKKRIQNTDRHRAAYYNCSTDRQWGASESYQLCIDSGLFGIDGTVSALRSCLQVLEAESAVPAGPETTSDKEGR